MAVDKDEREYCKIKHVLHLNFWRLLLHLMEIAGKELQKKLNEKSGLLIGYGMTKL